MSLYERLNDDFCFLDRFAYLYLGMNTNEISYIGCISINITIKLTMWAGSNGGLYLRGLISCWLALTGRTSLFHTPLVKKFQSKEITVFLVLMLSFPCLNSSHWCTITLRAFTESLKFSTSALYWWHSIDVNVKFESGLSCRTSSKTLITMLHGLPGLAAKWYVQLSEADFTTHA